MDDLQPGNVSTRLARRGLLLLVVIVALVLAGGMWLAIHTYTSCFDALEMFSATWQTHDMLHLYMYNHNGEWPENWDDLRPYFAMTNGGYGAPDLAWVRERVGVEFGFDPIAFASSAKHHDGQLRMLYLADGGDNGEVQDANDRLRAFILSRATAQAGDGEGRRK